MKQANRYDHNDGELRREVEAHQRENKQQGHVIAKKSAAQICKNNYLSCGLERALKKAKFGVTNFDPD
jgi:hypothetical protein